MLLVTLTNIKNVDNLLRLRSIRYRQTPNVLKLVNAHAMRRELSTSVLVHFLEILAIFRNKNQKWMFILYVLFKSYLSP